MRYTPHARARSHTHTTTNTPLCPVSFLSSHRSLPSFLLPSLQATTSSSSVSPSSCATRTRRPRSSSSTAPSRSRSPRRQYTRDNTHMCNSRIITQRNYLSQRDFLSARVVPGQANFARFHHDARTQEDDARLSLCSLFHRVSTLPLPQSCREARRCSAEEAFEAVIRSVAAAKTRCLATRHTNRSLLARIARHSAAGFAHRNCTALRWTTARWVTEKTLLSHTYIAHQQASTSIPAFSSMAFFARLPQHAASRSAQRSAFRSNFF